MKTAFMFVFFLWSMLATGSENFSERVSRHLHKALSSPVEFEGSTSDTLKIKCFRYPGNETYIMVEQQMALSAPLSKVAEVVEDFKHHKDLYEGLSESEVVSEAGHTKTVKFVQKVPVPFVADLVYELKYVMEQKNLFRRPTKQYLFSLVKSNGLIANDGFIVLQQTSQGRTVFREFDSWDAKWGALKVMGAKKIWSQNLEGIIKANLALKSKAEQPELSYADIHKKADDFSSDSLIQECFDHRTDYPY